MNNLKKITISVSSLPKNGWWNSGIVAYHDNDMMSNGAIPNQELLKKEHENLIGILHKHSLETIIIPSKSFGSPHLPTIVFSLMLFLFLILFQLFFVIAVRK